MSNKERIQEQISSYGPGTWFNKNKIKKDLGLNNYKALNSVIESLVGYQILESQPGVRKGTIEYCYRDQAKLARVFQNSPVKRPGTHRNGSSNNGKDSETLQVGAQNLIDRFSVNWKGRIPLDEELENHEAWFLRTRLPWLVFDSFYHFGSNRLGDHKTVPGTKGVPYSGWDTTEEARKDREIFLSSSKEDLMNQVDSSVDA